MSKKGAVREWTKYREENLDPKRIGMMVGGLIVGAFFLYSFVFMDNRSTLNVDRNKLTISTVQENSFQDFIRFLDYAQSSAQEVISLLYIIADREMANTEKIKSVQDQCQALILA